MAVHLHLGHKYEIKQGPRLTVYIDGVEQEETFLVYSDACDYAFDKIETMMKAVA